MKTTKDFSIQINIDSLGTASMYTKIYPHFGLFDALYQKNLHPSLSSMVIALFEEFIYAVVAKEDAHD